MFIENKPTNTRILRVFLKAALKYRGAFYVALFGVLLARITGLTAPIFYKRFFDTLATLNFGLVPALQAILLTILAIYVLENLLRRIAIFSAIFFQSRTMSDLWQSAEAYLMGHSYHFFSDNFSGSLVRRVTKMPRSFETISDDFLFNIIPLGVSVTFISAVLFSRDYRLGVAMFLWVAIFLSINIALAKWKQRFDLRKAELDSKLTGFLSDIVSNSLNVQLYTANKHEEGNFNLISQEHERARRFTWNIDAIIDSIQTLLTIGIEIILMFTAVNLWKQGIITIGDFALIQAYLITVVLQIWDFGRVLRRQFEALADASEIIQILDTPHEIHDAITAKPLKPSGGEISFQHVSFSFNKTRTVLKEFSLVVAAGERIALVGPSGAGKSTITKLLFRLYDVDHGRIQIDGQNIAEVTLNSLRDTVALVPQDPILFHRTLLENIRYGNRDASNEDVIEAARQANCHDFIMDLPEAYNTFVGERGVRLSGGERQRVAIARAILKNAPILVLDEATSSLDSESELLIQDALKKLMKNRTTIVIAHRLSTIMEMDRIIVIEEGGISESGTHTELLERNGTYKRLWEIQAGGFIT